MAKIKRCSFFASQCSYLRVRFDSINFSDINGFPNLGAEHLLGSPYRGSNVYQWILRYHCEIAKTR